MSTIHLRTNELHTFHELPPIGQEAPDFTLTATDLSTKSLADFKGKSLLLNVFPSIDTRVCYSSVKQFHESISNHSTLLICISMDLPFALKRVQEGEGLDQLIFLSDFRNREFGDQYGLTIADGALAGLLARAVLVLDENHTLVYHELVEDISEQPNYEKALAYLDKM